MGRAIADSLFLRNEPNFLADSAGIWFAGQPKSAGMVSL
jgi:hypothetical protein